MKLQFRPTSLTATAMIVGDSCELLAVREKMIFLSEMNNNNNNSNLIITSYSHCLCSSLLSLLLSIILSA